MAPIDAELTDPRMLPDATSPDQTVLLCGVLPDDRAELVDVLTALRVGLMVGATVRIVDEERPLRPESAARRTVRTWRARKGPARRTSVIEALRTAGWTVASVDRITVDEHPSRLWVDLTAVDLSTIGTESGEGDRDERSE